MNDRPLINRPLRNIDARSSKWEEPPWPSAFELARPAASAQLMDTRWWPHGEASC